MSTSMQERRDAIAQFVTAEGSVTFGQLKKAFSNVSEMTLRTDLKALDEARRIVRTHGGARSVEYVVGTDDLLLNRSTRNVEAKALIARKAKGLVRPDSTIFLDSGTTTTAHASSTTCACSPSPTASPARRSSRASRGPARSWSAAASTASA